MTEKKITISDYYYKKTEIDNLLNNKEDKSNKVTSLSSESTDDEYPSAKAVYDDVTQIYNSLSNGLNSVSNNLSNTITTNTNAIWETLGPLSSTKQDKTDNNLATTDKTVVGAINELNTNKEDKSNKVTSLSSSSTDDQYPSAKVLYSNVDNIWNTLGPLPSKIDQKQDKITSTAPLNASYVNYTSYAEWLNLPAGSSQAVVNEKILSYLLTVRNNKADKTEIPTKTSQLTNDSGFLTQHQNISGKEDTSNKVTSLSSSSTNTQYPSARAVYDAIPSDTVTLTATLENGTTKTFTIYGNENTGD